MKESHEMSEKGQPILQKVTEPTASSGFDKEDAMIRSPRATNGRAPMIRAFFLLMMGLLMVAGCGGSGENGVECGPHGVAAGDGCLCDSGFQFNGTTCVGGSDGDYEPARTDEDVDEGGPDGDLPDGDLPDGDTIPVDGDKDRDPDPISEREESDPICSCPSLIGVFCVDPLIANPAGYVRVEVFNVVDQCALDVRVHTSRLVAYYNPANACDAQGRLDLPQIGCTLSYENQTDIVYLDCATTILNFRSAYCETPDGDAETDGDRTDAPSDEEGAPDGDQTDAPSDEDGAAEEDAADSPSDGDETPDGDAPSEGEDDPGTPCVSNEGCPLHFYCDIEQLPWICKEGCGPSRPCGQCKICSDHGICEIQEDCDTEGSLCTPENEAEFCGYGKFCNESTSECTCFCGSACGGAECAEGFACDPARGRCQPLSGSCTLDADCPDACQFCNGTGACQSGCCETSECLGYCEICTHGRCVTDPGCLPEQEVRKPCTSENVETDCGYGYFCNEQNLCDRECPGNAYCQEHYGSTFICNAYGMCVAGPGACQDDNGCPTGFFCDHNACTQVCRTTADCNPLTGSVCDSRGRCVQPEYDTDAGCVSDTSCGTGTYCKGGACGFDCQSSADCAEGSYCDSTGRCRLASDLDIAELDVDFVVPVPCATDSNCSEGWYCNSGTGLCQQDCTPPANGCSSPFLACNNRGHCVSCGGDTDLECAEWDTDFDVPPAPYCDQSPSSARCSLECRCRETEYCDLSNYTCGALNVDGDFEAECTPSLPCPAGSYCDINYKCVSECSASKPCGEKYVCQSGHCNPIASACVSDLQCPKGTYCNPVDYTCRSTCFPATGCGLDRFCSDRGICYENGSTPPATTFPTCATDEDCPVVSHCQGGICQSDCAVPFMGCLDGTVCDLRGRCVTETSGGDEDGGTETEEAEPDEEIWDPQPIYCSTDANCPYHTFCGSGIPKVCITSCTDDFQCPSGTLCDCRGRCVTTLPNEAQCGSFLSCEGGTACPNLTYCWTDRNPDICRTDCIVTPDPNFNFPCVSGETCSHSGQCQGRK